MLSLPSLKSRIVWNDKAKLDLRRCISKSRWCLQRWRESLQMLTDDQVVLWHLFALRYMLDQRGYYYDSDGSQYHGIFMPNIQKMGKNSDSSTISTYGAGDHHIERKDMDNETSSLVQRSTQRSKRKAFVLEERKRYHYIHSPRFNSTINTY